MSVIFDLWICYISIKMVLLFYTVESYMYNTKVCFEDTELLYSLKYVRYFIQSFPYNTYKKGCCTF